MFAFDKNYVFAGYLKQLLASFNLPTSYRIYTKEDKRYEVLFSEYHKLNLSLSSTEINKKIKQETGQINHIIPSDPANNKYINYIKDDEICYFYKGIWHTSGKTYVYNKKDLNYTETFRVKNGSIYDSAVHEYLGNFLRFHRDYYDINLRPLYNCFSNRLANNITMRVNGERFNSADKFFKIYMIPVKLFSEYTIAIDCDSPVSRFCGLYGVYLDSSELNASLQNSTYIKYNSLSFSQPVIYQKLAEVSKDLGYLSAHEKDLKLFIKLPATAKTSITVLEGDYSGYNNTVLTKFSFNGSSIWKAASNKYITNYEPDRTDFAIFNPITTLKLLEINTGMSYPFADRLIEYLLNNVITPEDDLSDNIKRVQAVRKLNGIQFDCPGLWQDKIRHYAYDYMQDYRYHNTDDSDHDILGYIDKDVETNYTSWKTVYATDAAGKKIPVRDSQNNIIWQYHNHLLAVANSLMLAQLSTAGQAQNDAALAQLIAVTTDSPIIDQDTNSRVPAAYRIKHIPSSTIQNVDIYK